MLHTVGTGIKSHSRTLFLLPAQAWGWGRWPLVTPGACSCPCLDFSLTLPAPCSCSSSPAAPPLLCPLELLILSLCCSLFAPPLQNTLQVRSVGPLAPFLERTLCGARNQVLGYMRV